MMELKIERIYTKPVDLDGYRILVDRIWPRGISKENAHLDKWLKEVGPSTELRNGLVMTLLVIQNSKNVISQN